MSSTRSDYIEAHNQARASWKTSPPHRRACRKEAAELIGLHIAVARFRGEIE